MSVEIAAPMPGNIIEILVKVGDAVKESDEVIILEAMKMENPIFPRPMGRSRRSRNYGKFLNL